MRSGNVTKKPWFNIVSCVVASFFRRSTLSFFATHETLQKATDNVNVYISFSRRPHKTFHPTNHSRTKKLLKLIFNKLRMVFVKQAMNRRIMSIFMNRYNFRFMFSRLVRVFVKERKLLINNSDLKVFRVKAIVKAFNINEDRSLRSEEVV